MGGGRVHDDEGDGAMADYKLLIDGELCEAASGETFETTNPATGKKLADLPKAGVEDAERAILSARKAFEGGWGATPAKERAEKLRAIAALIMENASVLAELESLDSGGTIRKSQLADIPGAAGAFEWFARMADEQPEQIELPGSPFPPSQNYVRWEPYGVCTGIIPWNFPFIMASWKIAPALAAGNCSVLKPASFTSVTALKLAELIAEADILPPGVLNVISGPGGSVGEVLASHPEVDKTAFTGSTEVGRRVMQLASGTIKAVTLELGGKSANIVLDDADVDAAAAVVLWGTFFHNGQVCESGTRALVHRSIYDDFVASLADRAGKIALGDPMDMMTDQGALVSRSQVETVERYVQLGRDEVGEPICGGRRPEHLAEGLDTAAYYEPTIFADVDNKAKIAQEEIFGPVLCVIPFETEDEAIAIANDSIYGLAGGVQSTNIERAHSVANRMRTGTVWINDYHMISPERPFGGYKQSGIGRELGTQGYDAYRQAKHVHTYPDGGKPFTTGVLSGNV